MLTPHQGFTFNKFDKPNDWPELESTFDYKIEDGKLLGANDNIALSGPVDYTKVGNLTIVNGIASGWSSSNYLNIGANNFDLSKSWDFVFLINSQPSEYRTGTFIALFASWSNYVVFQLASGILRAFIKINGTLIAESENCGTISENTKYKIYYRNGDIIVSNAETSDVLKTFSMSAYSFPTTAITPRIGHSGDYGTLNSSVAIDLNNTYIKVNNKLWFGKKHRQYEAANGVVTKNTMPVPEGLTIGNFTTPSNGMFDIVTQTFEPFEYYPIIKTDSNMLQVESKQNVGEVNYTVVGNPTIVDGVASGFTANDYLEIAPSIDAKTIDECVFKFNVPSSALGQNRYMNICFGLFSLYVYSGASELLYSSFNFAGLGNLRFNKNFLTDKDYWVKYTNDGTNCIAWWSEDGVNYIQGDSQLTSSLNGLVYLLRIGGRGDTERVFDGYIDLNETYIKVNDQVWFGKQKPEAKLVGPVDYTVVGSPTISNGVASGFSSSDYLTLPNSPTSISTYSYKITATIYSIPSSGFPKIYTFFGQQAEVRSDTTGTATLRFYYPGEGGAAAGDGYFASGITLNVPFSISVNYDSENTSVIVEQSGVQLKSTTITASSFYDKVSELGRSAFPGSIDLNNTYIKVNNTLWFGKENWTPCIFDDNSIMEFTGHTSDYSSYNTYAFKPTIENSGTYDVWIDNQKVYENVTSASNTEINWSNLALTTGYSVTTPEALKAHILKITPSNKSNKFTAFRHVVSSYTASGYEVTGVLQMHFELDYELNLARLTNSSAEVDTASYRLQAVTSKTNELKVSAIYQAFRQATQLKRLPKFSTNDAECFQTLQNVYDTKYIAFTKARLGYYSFYNSNLEKIDGDLSIASSDYVFGNNKKLKHLPNIIEITTTSLQNYITNASSLQSTNIDLSSKDDLKKLDIYGTSSYRIDGLKSLKVSNEAPFNGTSPQINVSYTGLERPALVELFNSLPTVSGGQTINITGCVGTSSLTSDDKAIATNKGWTITEA